MKKIYSYTYEQTIKNFEGDNILYDFFVLTRYMKKNHIERINRLTEEQKERFFYMSYHYRSTTDKLMDKQIINFADPGWNEERVRNPKEEYENFISLPRDEDYTDEEYELKLNHLREFKEWFEKQNY
jgi:hypothetical protein